MSSTEKLVNGAAPGDQFHRFLRYGHVLRSLLREFLEEDFLRQVCPHRLTRSQFCFLKLIAANSDLKVGELARSIGVSAAAASKNLDKLERLGLVTRETSSEDRRAILLSASAAGCGLVRAYERHKADHLTPVIEALGPEKTRQLCDLLEEVCSGMLERVANPRETCLRCAGYYRPDCVFEEFQGECALKPRRGEVEA
jgi:DNA-binding MarR family transcriptional regulator